LLAVLTPATPLLHFDAMRASVTMRDIVSSNGLQSVSKMKTAHGRR